MNKKMKTAAVVAAAGVAAALVITYFAAYSSHSELMQGQIEAQQYFVSAKVPGRIEQVLVQKGQNVKVGDRIFVLSTPELDAKLNQAKAGEAAAGAVKQEVDNGARTQQIAAAKDVWMKAKAAAMLAEKTYQRVNALYRDGVMAEQKRDEAKTGWEAAKYTEQAAFQQYQLAVEGSRKGEKLAAAEKKNGRRCRTRSAGLSDGCRADGISRWRGGSGIAAPGRAGPGRIPCGNAGGFARCVGAVSSAGR